MLKQYLNKQKHYLDYFFSLIDVEKAEKILELFLQCEGMIVFTGVGKSGIIAEKLAMTLISTGTKALYLSPSNALHGDIGILSEKDLFVCLSKSGESEELLRLLPVVRNRKTKIVSWISNAQSKVANMSDEVMLLPLKGELCPFDLAPTTSATLQLIFGDVLAVALMEKKKFTFDQFAMNHPAGAIGKKLKLRVEDLMVRENDLPLCFPEDTLGKALLELSNKGCGCVLAVDKEKRMQGIFTDGDLRRTIQQNPKLVLQKRMKALVTTSFLSVEKKQMAIEALKIMQMHPSKWVKELPVLEDGKVVGLIRMHDIVQAGIS